jgi:hypothetical protein
MFSYILELHIVTNNFPFLCLKMFGGADFDKPCVFGNNVEMTPRHVSFLKAQVGGY